MAKRKVILHHHIFKNAGTSIDKMLRDSYADRWVNYDKPQPGAKISPNEMQSYILDNPDLVAISSHQVVPPLPEKYLDVYPLIMLRHPIDRAYSAYLFEWQKQLGKESPIGPFSQYIEQKFSYYRANAIEDFQVIHLANQSHDHRAPSFKIGDEVLLENSRNLLDKAGYFGIVDRYNESLIMFEKKLAGHFPDLKFKAYHENMLQEKTSTISEKVRAIIESLSERDRSRLILRNLLDYRLYEYALGQFSNILRNDIHRNSSS